MVHVPAVIALRNVGKEDLAVSLFPHDRFLAVTASGENGQAASSDLLGGQKIAPADFGPAFVKVVKPGEILFIGPMGESRYAAGFTLPLGPATEVPRRLRLLAGTRKARRQTVDREH